MSNCGGNSACRSGPWPACGACNTSHGGQGFPARSKWALGPARQFSLTFERREIRLAPTSVCSQVSFIERCGRTLGALTNHSVRVLANRAWPQSQLLHRPTLSRNCRGLLHPSGLRPWFPGRNHAVGIPLFCLDDCSQGMEQPRITWGGEDQSCLNLA
jgi:hypothetical protein